MEIHTEYSKCILHLISFQILFELDLRTFPYEGLAVIMQQDCLDGIAKVDLF